VPVRRVACCDRGPRTRLSSAGACHILPCRADSRRSRCSVSGRLMKTPCWDFPSWHLKPAGRQPDRHPEQSVSIAHDQPAVPLTKLRIWF
jgi:hypothetical protein